MFYSRRLPVSVQKIPNGRRKFKNFENSGNVGPILTGNLRKTADALDPCRILKLTVIDGFLQGEIFETAEIRLMLFQNSLVNRSGLRKSFRPFAKNNLLTPMLKDAIKCLFKNKYTGKPSLSFWFASNKKRGP